MYDYIRVDIERIPPRPAHMSETSYCNAVRELTEGSAQTKSLSCTMDEFVIVADGRLLIKGARCDHSAIGGVDPELADRAEPCADIPGYSWVKDFNGTIVPGDLVEFDFISGRVVTARTNR